jgi:hypothetical protein
MGTTTEAGGRLIQRITGGQVAQRTTGERPARRAAGARRGRFAGRRAPRTVEWTPQVGKTYTFAVLIKGVGGPITVHLAVERAGEPYDRAAKGANVVVPEGEWTDLHVSFKCDKPFPEGWQVCVSCAQDGGRYRADMFRFYEGDYVPWKPQAEAAAQAAGAPVNLIVNPNFASGEQPYLFDFREQENLRRTYRRSSFLVTRALANMGVLCSTPLLNRFSSPVSPDKLEKRWLEGLYVDQPEEWDEPYRWFGW